MAKTRQVDTRFWIDGYIAHLDPVEKLLFLYLITNEHTLLSGIYELPLKNMATETGIEIEMLKKILERFSRDKKIYRHNEWICVKNFYHYHSPENPKIKEGIRNALLTVPQEILNFFHSLDTLSIPYGYPMHRESPSASASASASAFISSAFSEKSGGNSEIPLKVVSDPEVLTPTQLWAYEAKHGSRYSTRKTEAPSADIVAVLDLFAPVNPAYLSLRVMMPQREAADRLLKIMEYKAIQDLVAFIVKNRAEQFMPTITTPVALEKKMGDLAVYYQKQNNKAPAFI